MIREVIETGKTIEIAIKNACEKLGASEDDVEVIVLEQPKKGILGLKSNLAKVRVVLEINKIDYAKEFLYSILDSMGLAGVVISSSKEEDRVILTMNGDDIGSIIGHHGETLDALQYIVGLVVNQLDGEYYRITLDCGNFREKREKSLETLAEKIAKQVLKYGNSVTLEPMNPYERRIIHSTVQKIENVTSVSTGEEPNRCVVISSTIAGKRRFSDNKFKNNNNSNNRSRGNYNSNYNKNSNNSHNDKKNDYHNKYNNTKSVSFTDTATVHEKSEPISDKSTANGLYEKIKLD
jgi:spoIIIJ-associated protein